MRRFAVSVGLAAAAFGAGMLVAGRPEVRAQTAGIQSVSGDRGLWLVRDGALYFCDPSAGAEHLVCKRVAMKFED